MQNNIRIAIVIPIYRSEFSDAERISLKQVVTVLGHYDIYFAMPYSLKINITGIQNECFSDSFFKSVKTYNSLMLDKQFYQRFIKYKYILIYQLDAFVFSDKLEFFCNMDFDYIGAPWLNGAFYYLSQEKNIWRVGNGGLSLRKVQSSIELLSREDDEILSTFKSNEDLFFSISQCKEFRTAPVEVALQFSFEAEVRKCFQLAGNKIPFGCHAWEKYDFDFWKPYIEKFGYQMPEKKKSHSIDLEYEQAEQRKETDFWEHRYSSALIKEILQKLYHSKGNNYVIWGAGFYGGQIGRMLDDAGLNVIGFIDNNEGLVNKEYCGKTIMKLEQYIMKYNNAKIIVALTKYHMEVARQLEEKGYFYKTDYLFYKDVMYALTGVEIYNEQTGNSCFF